MAEMEGETEKQTSASCGNLGVFRLFCALPHTTKIVQHGEEQARKNHQQFLAILHFQHRDIDNMHIFVHTFTVVDGVSCSSTPLFA